MRTKLLTSFIALLIGAGLATAQNQKVWALGQYGGSMNWGALSCINADGSGLAVAHTFDFTYGGTPRGNLLQASDGNIYGTCYDGGSFASCVIFRYDPSTDVYSDVWDFDITNGDFPQSGMVEGGNGKLYGAASGGGTVGAGVIYSYDLVSGVYTNVHSFNPTYGALPYGAPILLGSELYGMTTSGGNYSSGVIYSFDLSSQTYAAIHHFDGAANGAYPYGSLMQASNGKLYGMTSAGGANNAGIIFSIDPISGTFTKVHDMTTITGATPYGSLYQAQDGKLYGVTSAGGAIGVGVIFSLDITNNTYSDVFNFTTVEGATPQGDLSEDNNGMLYGTTASGGTGFGNIFRFDPVSHSCTSLMAFGGIYGQYPNGGVLITAATVGIGEHVALSNSSLNAFPNPATDQLNISFDAGQNSEAIFTLRNVLGEEVMSWKEENISGIATRSVDVSELSKGVYLLDVLTGEKRSTMKVSVK